MSGPANALLIVAVIAVIVVRQVRPRRISGGGRWWLVPIVMGVLAVRNGGLVDEAHRGASVALLVAGTAIGGALGVAWAATTRVWTAEDGTVWAQGTRTTIIVWLVGIGLRVGLYAVAVAMGVKQHSGSVLLAVAATLLIRGGVIALRAQRPEPSYSAVS